MIQEMEAVVFYQLGLRDEVYFTCFAFQLIYFRFVDNA